MTNAQERAERAQAAYAALVADNEKFAEAVTWIADAVERGRDFTTYYQDHWLADREEVGAGLPVMGEDPPWLAIIDHTEQLRRLLRIVTDRPGGPGSPQPSATDEH